MLALFRSVALPTAFLLSCVCSCPYALAQVPGNLSQNKIDILTRDGDRLADQGDYQGALEKYTTAYQGVVSRIRGQAFNSAVPPNIYNRDDLGKEMLRIMAEEYTDEELELMDSSYKAFGLVPMDLDCHKLITQLLTEEVAGFYDPDSKRMVLIVEDDGPTKDPGWLGRLLGAKPAFDKDEQKTTLAHELTHALQDQLYDLNALQAGIEKDDDMLTAFSALVEGDATLLMFAEMGDGQDVSEMDPDAMRATFNIMSWLLPFAGGQTYRKAPPIFRDSLTFPYFQGMIFNLTAAGEGGWDRIHQLYADPPTSTEQVLHPRKYFDREHRDVPQTVTIPDVQEIVGESWKHLGGNVLGELQTSIMLKRIPGGKAASEGWDGDRYEVFKSPDGKLGLLSVSVWDSPTDAQQFADAYRLYRQPPKSKPIRMNQAKTDSENKAVPETQPVPEKSQAETDDAIEPDAIQEELPTVGKQPATPAIERHIVVELDRVFIVEGFSAAHSATLLEKLKESSFAEKVFPMPNGKVQGGDGQKPIQN
ncbi:MAG: hypothetical protein R3C53_28375 [Pirellulaceae bacterium]